MKKNLRLFIIIFVSFLMFFLLNVKPVNAASANISGKTSAQKGESVTITASVNAGAWNLTLSGAGQSVQLVGQTNTTGNASDSKSITFVANSDTTFTLTGDITDYNEEIPRNVSKSTTVKVSEKTQSVPTQTNNNQSQNATNNNNNKKSNNANLSNLGIRPNDFSGFKAWTTTYNVTVPENVGTIEVYAKAQDSKAKVTGIGKKQLQKGKNIASVIVTAEDGTKKTYTINITRKEETTENKEDEQEENTDGEGAEVTEEIKANGLLELNIGDLNLSPEFQSDIYEYTVKYTGEDTRLDINTVATNEDYAIEIIGNEDLKEGENLITILVSDLEGNNIANYQITVIKSLIDEEELLQQLQREKEEKKDKMIMIGCVVAIVLAIIIIFIILRKRNREEYTNEYSRANNRKNNQLEDFDENMRYKGNSRNRQNKRADKEEYSYNYSKMYDDDSNKRKNRGKRFK